MLNIGKKTLNYNKFKKISLSLILIPLFLSLKSYGQYLISNEETSKFQDYDTKILPILGMPLTLFKILDDDQQKDNLKKIVDVCARVDYVYKKLMWGNSPCLNLPWKYDFVSELGKPLIYWEYSSTNKNSELEKKNTTIILGGVHADELTPIHMAFKIAQTLHDDPESYKDVRVIIAPLVNPDGFFAHPFKRTNANGVDLNRNFPTRTWES